MIYDLYSNFVQYKCLLLVLLLFVVILFRLLTSIGIYVYHLSSKGLSIELFFPVLFLFSPDKLLIKYKKVFTVVGILFKL